MRAWKKTNTFTEIWMGLPLAHTNEPLENINNTAARQPTAPWPPGEVMRAGRPQHQPEAERFQLQRRRLHPAQPCPWAGLLTTALPPAAPSKHSRAWAGLLTTALHGGSVQHSRAPLSRALNTALHGGSSAQPCPEQGLLTYSATPGGSVQHKPCLSRAL